MLIPNLQPFQNPTWTDIGTFAVLTAQLVLLGAAGFIAWRQLRAQNRPFVVIDLDIEPLPFIQLTIENLGSTLARDVRFDFTPPLASSMDSTPSKPVPIAEVSPFHDGIPSLAPGKRLAILFDDSRTRTEAESGLPDRYDVTVSYRGDPFQRPYRETFTLDIGMYRNWGSIRRKSVHDIAVQVEKIRDEIELLRIGLEPGAAP